MLDNLFNRKADDAKQDEPTENLDQDQVVETELESTEADLAEDAKPVEEQTDFPQGEDSSFVLLDQDSAGEADQAEDLVKADQTTEDSQLMVSPDLAASQLSFDEKVLEKIVAVAVKEMPGALLADGGGGFFNLKTNKGVEINVDDNDEVSLDLDLVLEYGKSAPEIYERLKVILHDRILQMTGLTLKNVNAHVVNILTSEEFAEK